AVCFNLVALRAEVTPPAPYPNDSLMHQLVLGRTAAAMVLGQDPTDPWVSLVSGLGFPLFNYYQHMPYLVTDALFAELTLLTRWGPALADVLQWTNYLLLSAFPLSIYWSLRKLGFSALVAAGGGAIASLPSSPALYGLEYGSYVWRGYGMYTQLWAMVLL